MNLTAEQIAAAIGAEVVSRGSPGSPRRGVIDSGEAGEGDLFFGLRGERVDGGEFAPAALAAGAWGAVVGSAAARSSFAPDSDANLDHAREDGWVFAVEDPLQGVAGPGAGLAARARRPGGRDHRLGR